MEGGKGWVWVGVEGGKRSHADWEEMEHGKSGHGQKEWWEW